MVDESKFQAEFGSRGRMLFPGMHHTRIQILGEPERNYILAFPKQGSFMKKEDLRKLHRNDEQTNSPNLAKFLKSAKKVSTYFNKWFYLHKKDALKPIRALWQRLPFLYKSKHFASKGLNDSVALIDRFATKMLTLKENLKKVPRKERKEDYIEIIRNLNKAYKLLDQGAEILDNKSSFRSMLDLFDPFLNLSYESSKPDGDNIIVIKALGLAYDLSENFNYVL